MNAILFDLLTSDEIVIIKEETEIRNSRVKDLTLEEVLELQKWLINFRSKFGFKITL